MRILITGGHGFVGTWLTEALHDAGHEVIASDRIDCDLSEPGNGAYMIRTVDPDYVVHLAALYGRLLCRDEPHQAVSDNTASTVEVAAQCAEFGVPVLYASSSEVYGDHGTDMINEQSELRMPTTIYGLSKRWGEEALELYQVRRCVVRMNMLYGPEQLGGYGRCSLATFIDNAVHGESFTVHAGTSRSWLFISDAVRALRLLIEDGHTGVFNLGNPAEPIPMTTVGKMVLRENERLLMEEMKPRAATMVTTHPPADQIAHKNYDCSKLLRRIDWQPEVGLEQGIRETFAWARQLVEVEA